MNTEKVVCPKCGKLTTKKKRCMYCYAILPEEDQARMGGSGTPYWQTGSG